MKKEEFEALLARIGNEEQKNELMLAYYSYGKLYNKFIVTGKLSDKKNYQEALAEIYKIKDKIFPDEAGPQSETLENVAAVLDHLEQTGWKITKTSLYRHQKQGKILPDSEGKYLKRSVDKYAKTFLKQTATGKRVVEETDELQRKKLIKEIARIELGLERDQFALDKERGLYIPKDQVEIELATRAGILVAGFKHWGQSSAADWIALVGGDMKKVGELINKVNNGIDELINQYASSKEYEVIIEAEKIIEENREEENATV